MIGDRIKELRKALGMTQTEFGQSIGVTRDGVAQYERNTSNASKSTLMLICKTFNVNPDWLDNGGGEMFIEMGIEDQIAAFAGDMMKLPQTDPRKIILRTLAELPEDRWKELAEMLMDAARRAVDTSNTDPTE